MQTYPDDDLLLALYHGKGLTDLQFHVFHPFHDSYPILILRSISLFFFEELIKSCVAFIP